LPPLDLSRFFDVHPILETERIILRQLTLSDLEDVFENDREPEFVRYTPHVPAKSISDTEAYLRRIAKTFSDREVLTFGFERKSDKKIMGHCSLHNIVPQHHRAEIGYGISPAYWGEGYAFEGVKEIIQFGFEEMGIHRIEASCDPRNVRSIKLAERCGMVYEGTLREHKICKGERVSSAIYSILNG
jgi:[ribosomal protein S5]-alanine N-acetyltransferase